MTLALALRAVNDVPFMLGITETQSKNRCYYFSSFTSMTHNAFKKISNVLDRLCYWSEALSILTISELLFTCTLHFPISHCFDCPCQALLAACAGCKPRLCLRKGCRKGKREL